jgi:putative membrane protein
MDKNVKTALIIGGIIVAALIVLPSVSGLIWGGQYGGWGMMGPGMMGGFGTMGVMSIIWIVVLGLIIWAVVALVRGGSQSGGSDSSSSRPDSALEILKERYARGEINKAEFEEKKKDLI